jgi:hypothetical protein
MARRDIIGGFEIGFILVLIIGATQCTPDPDGQPYHEAPIDRCHDYPGGPGDC